jgi:hypothetical protein
MIILVYIKIHRMKNVKYFLFVFALILIFSGLAQAQKLPGLDPSPADIVYLRQDGRGTAPVAKVIYGRPQKKGRTLLGDKEPYGKVWRLGANETTEIKLYKDVTFGDKQIPAGTYSLYAIPDKTEWTLIFNSKLDTWGAFEYEESKDVARIKAPVTKPEAEVEAFTIAFEGGKGTANMMIAWENTLVKVPVKY